MSMVYKEQQKKKKSCSGYLTVFLTLCLTAVISLCLVLIRGVYNNSIKTEGQIAADIGMNSILAEYHRELFHKYDLLFVDTSYGTAVSSPSLTSQHLSEYLNKNFSNQDLLFHFYFRDLLQIKLDSAEVTGICLATDDSGKVLRRQAVDYMYDKIGLSILKELEKRVTTVNQYRIDFEQLQQMRLQTAEQLETLYEEHHFSEEDDWTQSIYQNVTSQREGNVLDWLMLIFSNNFETVSQNQVDLNQYVSPRGVNKGSGIHPNISYQEGLMEQLLFQEYLMEKTGNYITPSEDSPLTYETEYLIGGKSTDTENLAIVISELLFVRQAANYTYLLSDENKMLLVQIVSELLAVLLEAPGTEKIFETAILLGWSFSESIYDVRALLAGGKVPLMKTADNWFLDMKMLLGPGVYFLDTSVLYDEGLSYEEYLRILLFFQNTSVKTMRFMDIVEMNIRNTPGNANFRMDGCADGFQFDIHISAKNKRQYSIQRWCGYY